MNEPGNKYPQGYFITATDTDVGKTWVTLGLMAGLRKRGAVVTGMKPVASGCDITESGPRNKDARMLMEQAVVRHDYALVNPYAFVPAIAPHIAARQAGVCISMEHIRNSFQQLRSGSDYALVEGIGGWRVPLNERETLVDLVRVLGLPVILVVGMRLGCINHALLSTESILADGVALHGWVANRIDPGYEQAEDTITTLSHRIPAPLLGQVPYLERLDADEIAANLNTGMFVRDS